MSLVRTMVDYFEDLIADKRLSMCSLPDRDEIMSNGRDDDDDDDLLSYGSDDDESDAKKSPAPNVNKQQQCQNENDSPILLSESNFELDDEHTLVYSSDDDDDDRMTQTSSITMTTCTVNTDLMTSPKNFQNDINIATMNENDDLPPTPKTANNEARRKDMENKKYMIDVVNVQGESPLTIASMNCLTEVMRMFISYGCDVNVQDMNGSSPLHMVCINQNSCSSGSSISNERLACTKLLLENGANVNCQDHQGCTPLHKAAANGYTQCVRTLLLFGACPSIQDYKGNIVLHEATASRNVDIIKMLIESDVCSDYSCVCHLTNSPQSHTMEEGIKEEHQQYHQLQGDNELDAIPKLQTENENSPPPSARSLEVWNRFFENAAKSTNYDVPTGVDNDNDYEDEERHNNHNYYNDSLHDAIVAGDINRVKYLLEAEQVVVDINERDKFGNSPLHLAAQRGDLRMILMLVEYGADVHCENAHHETPLHLCWSNGHTRCADFLLCHGDDDDHFEKEENQVLLRSFDVYNYVCQVLSTFMNIVTQFFFQRRNLLDIHHQQQHIPDDVAQALHDARSNNKLKVDQTLEPPYDLKIALKKAGFGVNHHQS